MENADFVLPYSVDHDLNVLDSGISSSPILLLFLDTCSNVWVTTAIIQYVLIHTMFMVHFNELQFICIVPA